MGVHTLPQSAVCRAWPPAGRRWGSPRQPQAKPLLGQFCLSEPRPGKGNPGLAPSRILKWLISPLFPASLQLSFFLPKAICTNRDLSPLHLHSGRTRAPGDSLFGWPPPPRGRTLGPSGTPSCKEQPTPPPFLLLFPTHSELCFRQPLGSCTCLTYPQPPGITGKAITSGLSCSLILIKDSGH